MMKQGCVCDLNEEVALSAARFSFQMDLPLVESIMLATARAKNARLWTQDERLRGIDGVTYRAKARVVRAPPSQPFSRSQSYVRGPISPKIQIVERKADDG